jgi:hypothetical protein
MSRILSPTPGSLGTTPNQPPKYYTQIEPPWDRWRLHTLEVPHATLSATMDENGVSGKARLTLVRGARLED